MKTSRLEQFAALASELGAHLSAEEMNALITKHSLPVHSPARGFAHSPSTKQQRGAAKSRSKTYTESMAEGAAALSNAIGLARKGHDPQTPDSLVGRWGTGVHASNFANTWEGYEPACEQPKPVDRDPCFRCGSRSDIGCGCC